MVNWIGLFNNSRLLRKMKLNYTSRWIILALDMILVSLSFFIVVYIRQLMTGNYVLEPDVQLKFILVFIAYLFNAWLFKTYTGVVRYSGIEDSFRLLLMVISSNVTLILMNLVGYIFSHHGIFSLVTLCLQGMMVFSALFFVRLLVKIIYAKFLIIGNKKKNVIMLGAAVNSVVLANALKAEIEGKYQPVALLDLNGKKDKSINGMPIVAYDENRIGEIFEKYHTRTLIFLATQINLMKNGLAEKFLNAGIEILQLNQIEEFEGTDDSQKNISTHVHNIQIEDLLGREPIKTDNPAIQQQVRNKVVLITGAAGSIGSEIVRQLAIFGADQIIMFDQAETPLNTLYLEMKEKFPETTVIPFMGDVRNLRRLEQVFNLYHPHYIYHAAAYKHVPMMELHPVEAILDNVEGTKNVADYALKYGAEKFVMISTDKAVNPTNVMGASKRIAEIYIQSLFFMAKQCTPDRYTRFITTRFGNVLGSNGSVVPLFKEQIAKGGPLTVTHKDIIRYFMTIPEACNLVLEAGCMGKGGEIYVFDMGSPVKIYDLAKKMISLSGLTLGKDIVIKETGLRPGEKLYEELLNDKETTLPTYHPKIMIGKVRQYPYEEVVKHIGPMLEHAHEGRTMEVVAEMKRLVPEFISRNSVFESLDRQKDPKKVNV